MNNIENRFVQQRESWLSVSMQWALATLVLMLATALRIYNIDTPSLWADELWGVMACSQGSWWAMLRDLVVNDSHPPGYQTLLYVWMQLLPLSDLMIRLPSALAGIAAVWVIFSIGCRRFSFVAGIVAAALLACSYQAVYYSQEARAYAFLLLLAPVCASYFSSLFLFDEQGWREKAGFCLANVLLAYFHYVGVVFLAGEVLVFGLLACFRDRPFVVTGLKLFALIWLCYAPWLPVMYHHWLDAPDSWSTATPDVGTLWQTLQFLTGPDALRSCLTVALLLLALLLAAVEWFRCTARRQAQFLLLLVVLSVLPVVIFFLKSVFGQSAYTLRHFIYMIPVMALMSGVVVARLVDVLPVQIRHCGLLLLLLGIVLSSVWQNDQARLYNNNFRNDFRGAVALAARDAECAKGVQRCLFVESQDFFRYYTRRIPLPGRELLVANMHDMPALQDALAANAFDVFYFMTVKDGEPSVVQLALEAQYRKLCETRLNKMLLMKFARADGRQAGTSQSLPDTVQVLPDTVQVLQDATHTLPDCPLYSLVDKDHIR